MYQPDVDWSTKIFKPARDKSAAPGVETKALIPDTGFAFLSGYNTKSVLGYCRWLVSTQRGYLCVIPPHISHFVCKNVLGRSSACWGVPKGFCRVQPGFSSLFLNERSENDILVPERESFKLHMSTIDCALHKANSIRQTGRGLGLWKYPLNTTDLMKTLCSCRDRANSPPHQSAEDWQGQKQPMFGCMKTLHYENLPKTIQREK